MSDHDRQFWRAAAAVSMGLGLWALWDAWRLVALIRANPFASSWTVLLALLLGYLLASGALLAVLRRPNARLDRLAASIRLPQAWQGVTWLVFALLLVAYPYVVMASPYRWYLASDPASGVFVTAWRGFSYELLNAATGLSESGAISGRMVNPGLHLWLFWTVGLLAAALLRLGRSRPAPLTALALTLTLQAVIYRIALFLPDISTSPLSLGWSEASRYYYASLWFAGRIYGQELPLSVWHPTRYMLQSLPFLIPGLPIVAHRAWQVLLWVALTGATAVLLSRRLRINDPFQRWTLAGFAFLFLLQGAVYYHLLVCVLLVLGGYAADRPMRTLAVVLLASFWAGMSRLNWFPVPGMLAALLFLLDTPVGAQKWWRYLPRPALLFGLGLLAAFAGQTFYIQISGNSDLRSFGSSLTSDLLWYRLLPNPSFPEGVIPLVLLVSAPLLLILVWSLRGLAALMHPLRWLGLAGITLVLLGGGLVVSTKIGGGGDLHNMDAYLVVLLLIGCHLPLGRFTPEPRGGKAAPRPVPWSLAALALFIPAWLALSSIQLLEQPDPASRQYAVDIRQRVQQAAGRGEVLFISQRQLMTFGLSRSIALVPEYEVIQLMEMSMSDNRAYLERFYADLRRQRFEMIVAGQQFITFKGAKAAFGEENDVWVEHVSIPLLCWYEPVATYQNVDIQLFVPRRQPVDCPLP